MTKEDQEGADRHFVQSKFSESALEVSGDLKVWKYVRFKKRKIYKLFYKKVGGGNAKKLMHDHFYLNYYLYLLDYF